jgi:hypothetical protein
MLSNTRRKEAERVCRLETDSLKEHRSATNTVSVSGIVGQTENDQIADSERKGFSPYRTRMSVFFKVLLPYYVTPLFCCTTCAVFMLFGLTPAFINLERYESAPRGNIEFEICCE